MSKPDQAPAAEEAAAEPAQDQATEAAAGEGKDYKALYEEALAQSRKWEKRSKDNRAELEGLKQSAPKQDPTVEERLAVLEEENNVFPAYAGMILDRALADNSIAMTERRSMNDRQFRLNARRPKKEKGFLTFRLTDCLDAWKHMVSALMRKPFGMLCGKAVDAAVRTSSFARVLVPWKTRMGRR